MSDNSQNPEPMEVLQPSALHALERAQIDTQVATAHQYPRSIAVFKKRALDMATLDEETAESCIYCRPVGKEKNDRGQWVEKYAEGPSIRLAEIVGCSYGNLRVASRIIEQTPRYVKCEGVCHDLESNYAGKSEIVEPTVTKEGQPYSERQRALIAKVALAKAYRDAIFKVVPRALCKPILDAAKKTATGQTKSIEERRNKARAWFATLRIGEERAFAAMNIQGWAEATDEHLLLLTGLKTGLKENELTVDEAFPPVAKAPEQTGPPVPKQDKPAAKTAEKPVEKPAQKAPEKAPEPPQATDRPSEAQKPQEAPAQQQDTPVKSKPTLVEQPLTPEEDRQLNGTVAAANSGTEKPQEPPPAKTEEQELAEAGLAPAEPEAPPAAEAPAAPVEDPRWEPRDTDSEGVKSIRLLCKQNNLPLAQLEKWLDNVHLLKAGQKHVEELSTAKVDGILRNFQRKLEDIKAAK